MSLMNRAFYYALCTALISGFGSTVNAAAPVVDSANSFDGRTIGVCFSEVLDSASASNIANYTIGDTNYMVISAQMRPDQRSVVLQISPQYPGAPLSLLVRNVGDIQGNSTPTGFITWVNNLTSTNVGTPGSDPTEQASVFNCSVGNFEAIAGGSGLDGARDAFHFVYEPWRARILLVGVVVDALEVASRFSAAGLMVREDLTPGSRFFALVVTPPATPAKDGSGLGANRLEIRYRDKPNTPSATLPISVLTSPISYPIALDVYRDRHRFKASVSGDFVQSWTTIGELAFSDPWPDAVLVGMATTSDNNQPGFRTRAIYTRYAISRGDPPLPLQQRLELARLGGQVVLSWLEPPDGLPFYLVSSPRLGQGASWAPVPESKLFVKDEARVVVPLDSALRFFALKTARY
jgi:hypothetical protein